MDWQIEFKCDSRKTAQIAQQFRNAARKQPVRVVFPDGGEGSYLGFELAYSLRKQHEMAYGWGVGAKTGYIWAFTARSAAEGCRVVCASMDQALVEQELAKLREAGWSHFILSWE